MVGILDYAREGIPPSLLGCSYRSWQRVELRIILDHYGREYRPRASKLELMRSLYLLTRRHPLTRRDKRHILFAHRRERSRSRNTFVAIPVTDITQNGDDSTSDDDTNEAEDSTETEQPGNFRTIDEDRDDAEESGETCTVCYEKLNESNLPKQSNTSACQHKRDVCRQCIETSITTQLHDKEWDQIGCPSCGERLNYHDVRSHARKADFER